MTLQKALLGHQPPQLGNHLTAQHNVALDGGVPQVKEAVFKSRVLVGILTLVDLEGQLVVDALAQHFDFLRHDLNVLPVGSVPPNPSELLGLPKFAEMLEALKSQYDFIFIDCPPIEMVADTQIIDRYADRTFFITQYNI